MGERFPKPAASRIEYIDPASATAKEVEALPFEDPAQDPALQRLNNSPTNENIAAFVKVYPKKAEDYRDLNHEIDAAVVGSEMKQEIIAAKLHADPEALNAKYNEAFKVEDLKSEENGIVDAEFEPVETFGDLVPVVPEPVVVQEEVLENSGIPQIESSNTHEVQALPYLHSEGNLVRYESKEIVPKDVEKKEEVKPAKVEPTVIWPENKPGNSSIGPGVQSKRKSSGKGRGFGVGATIGSVVLGGVGIYALVSTFGLMNIVGFGAAVTVAVAMYMARRELFNDIFGWLGVKLKGGTGHGHSKRNSPMESAAGQKH